MVMMDSDVNTSVLIRPREAANRKHDSMPYDSAKASRTEPLLQQECLYDLRLAPLPES